MDGGSDGRGGVRYPKALPVVSSCIEAAIMDDRTAFVKVRPRMAVVVFVI